MGINIGRSSSRIACNGVKPATTDLPNPNPANYKILKMKEMGRFLILKIHYPDCTTFEGNKILVFQNVKLINLVNQKLIDPHFFESSEFASPIARFIPTKKGWNMALQFAQSYQDKP